MRLPRKSMMMAAAWLLAVSLGSEAPRDSGDSGDGGLAESLAQWTGAVVAFDPRQDVYHLEHPGPAKRTQVAGVPLDENPGAASYAAIAIREQASQAEAEVVLTANQVNPAIDIALAGHWELTGLAHLNLWDSPRLFRLACRSQGSPEDLAATLGRLFRVKPVGLKTSAIAGNEELTPFLARAGIKSRRLPGGFWMFMAPGADGRHTEQPEAGAWAFIRGTRRDAAMDAAWAVAPERVTLRVASLRRRGVWITAIASSTGQEPATVVVRGWGRGPLENLARAWLAGEEKPLDQPVPAW